MLVRTPRALVALAFAAFAAGACDDDPSGVTLPTVEDVAGTYVAEGETGLFVSVVDDEETDLLEAGATLSLVLAADGNTSGTLTMPGVGEEPGDEFDLEGSWTLSGFRVTLEIDAGSFLDDLELIWTDGRLDASGELDEETDFELELEREAEGS